MTRPSWRRKWGRSPGTISARRWRTRSSGRCSRARVIAAGGHRVDRQGYFYAPTVITNVSATMPVFAEETFGPVAAIIRARDVEEAIALANESPYRPRRRLVDAGHRDWRSAGARDPGRCGLHQRHGCLGPATAVRRCETKRLRAGVRRIRHPRIREHQDGLDRAHSERRNSAANH